ncbi:MAG TPA: methylated-DNA--[protein]-cysteine S-methyltransferase, partial [Candidatus Dormibacteraeota bacterium]|nr:methylated-DNA--[protein]-cysteine S-methyltransferase [Candidatus Dormibacteraeota bacterium]
MNTLTAAAARAPRTPHPLDSDPRWTALATRDARADGRFFYSVKTTGVYCRPSCAARLPRPANVAFHASAAAAERAGFRPCKRCRPDEIGADEVIRFALGKCSLGVVLVAHSTQGVCAILLGDSAGRLGRELRRRFPHARLLRSVGDGESLIPEVRRALEDPRRGFDAHLDLRGTDFQLRVWQALREIPPGSTLSYAEVARRIGAARAVRAVAQACAANALAVVVPCHRVVRADGTLSGYRWGTQR